MPDTGAPWNIPYVESTDLVSDWPADSLALANAIDAGLDAAGNAGIGSNVVQAVKTDGFSTTSTTPVLVTDLSVTITPTSASSKVLLLVNVNVSNANVTDVTAGYLDRDGTLIYRGVGGTTQNSAFYLLPTATDEIWNNNITYLDSPATTSAVTYEFQIATTSGGTARVNLRGDNSVGFRTASSITAIEVAA